MGKEGYTFSGCTSLETVTILGKIKEIDQYLFENCTSLKTVNLPDSVTKIDIAVPKEPLARHLHKSVYNTQLHPESVHR